MNNNAQGLLPGTKTENQNHNTKRIQRRNRESSCTTITML